MCQRITRFESENPRLRHEKPGAILVAEVHGKVRRLAIDRRDGRAVRLAMRAQKPLLQKGDVR